MDNDRSSPLVIELADPPWDMDRSALVQLARFVLQAEAVPKACVSIAFLDDVAMHRLNWQYLQHDYPTDVITFPLDDPLHPDLIVGDILIGYEYADRTATELGLTGPDEVALYLVHGLLHLCSYDDHNPTDRQRMHDRQADLLRQFRPINLGLASTS